MEPTLLVLAAGMGSRYGGLKQIDQVGPSEETILDYSIYDAVRAGFKKVVFVIRKDIEADFKAVFHERLSKIIQVEYVFQELSKIPDNVILPADRVKPLGTGHAVMMGAEKINEPFAVINADDYYGVETYKLIYNYLSKEVSDSEYCMVGFVLNNTLSEHGFVSRGLCNVDNNNKLKTVIELKKIKKENEKIEYEDSADLKIKLIGNEPVSMNFWGFHPSFFDHSNNKFNDFLKANINDFKSEYLLPEVVNELILEGKASVKVLISNSEWFGVTYKEDKPKVIEKIKALVDNDIYPKKLWV